MVPRRGGLKPITVRISVDLPTPLRPSTATMEAGATRRLTPCST